jgi:fatty acid synthase
VKVFIPIYSVTLHVTVIPFHINKQLGIIQSGGVEVRGVRASTITKRRNMSKPVLEKYLFTPYIEPAHLDLGTSMRVCTHIALENKPGIQVRVVEVHNQGTTPLSPVLVPIFADLPLLKASRKSGITQF